MNPDCSVYSTRDEKSTKSRVSSRVITQMGVRSTTQASDPRDTRAFARRSSKEGIASPQQSNALDAMEWCWKPNNCDLHSLDPIWFLQLFRNTDNGEFLPIRVIFGLKVDMSTIDLMLEVVRLGLSFH